MKNFIILSLIIILSNFLYSSFDDLFLDEDFFRVEEQLVVTASRRAQSITEAPATIYVISAREIEQYGFVDLKDVLKLIPGMIVEDANYGQLYGGQRGFSGTFSKTLIMINGREMNNLLAGETFIGPQYPLHNVDRIEVIAGPGSALYGANAFAGVINIITKSAADLNGVEVSYTMGKNNTNLLTMNYGLETNNSSLTISTRYKETDGYDFSDYVSYPERWNASVFGEDSNWRRNPEGYLYNTETGLVFRTPNTHGDRYESPEETKYFDFNYSRIIDSRHGFMPDEIYFGGNYFSMTTGHGMTKTQWITSGTSDHREMYLAYAGFNKSLLNNNLHINLEARFQSDWTQGNHTAIENIFHYPDDIEYSDSDVYDEFDTYVHWVSTGKDTPYTPTKLEIEKLRGYWGNKNNGADRYFVELQALYDIEIAGTFHNIIAGLVWDRKEAGFLAWSLGDAESYYLRPDGTMGVDFDRKPGFSQTNHNRDFYKQTKYAAYIQDQFSMLDDDLMITLGFRYDYHKNDDDDPKYSYNGIFNPRAGLIYKLTPIDTIKFLYGSAFREPSAYEMSPDYYLRPEEMQTYELGYIRNDLNYNYYFNINFYINRATDYIVSLATGTHYISGNAGNVDVQGAEIVFRYDPLPNLRFNMNYTYQTATLKAGGEKTDINPLPEHQANIMISYNIWNNLNIGWNTRWRAKVDNLNNTITGAVNPIESIDSYMVHDVTFLAKRIFGNDKSNDQLIDLSFTVKNLFDKSYENSNFRWDGSAQMDNPNVFGKPGRSYYLKVTAAF